MKNPVTIAITGLLMAEKEGFEPSRPFRGLHDFQSCALDQLGDFSMVVNCFTDAILTILSEEQSLLYQSFSQSQVLF